MGCPSGRRRRCGSATFASDTRTSSPSTASTSRSPPASASACSGPNGAGKTTTIEICEGLTVPDAGDVEVLGLRWATDATQLRQRLGIQLQDTQLADKLTVIETLRLFRSFYARGRRPTN